MRAGAEVSGSAIDRVFTHPAPPSRRFRGAIDATLTLAIGSVCAFGLTLGPAPLNTIAATSAAASPLADQISPAPESPLLPHEIGAEGSVSDQSEDELRPELRITDGRTGDAADRPSAGPPTAEPPAPPKKPHHPPSTQPSEKSREAKQMPQAQRPSWPSVSTLSEPVSAAAALSVLQDHRIASGLAAFVSADDCVKSAVHASVVVTPSALLPAGQAKRSLAPDPAFATVSEGGGAVTVTVHACQ